MHTLNETWHANLPVLQDNLIKDKEWCSYLTALLVTPVSSAAGHQNDRQLPNCE